ncbi:hypothetical protein [Gemmatimonas sp.]|jgi:hypothetical protein|uniref:hypothetical protein n=1 Tax=Gemmatimonas sp. TaxID=1962908 RepID=UPI0037C04999
MVDPTPEEHDSPAGSAGAVAAAPDAQGGEATPPAPRTSFVRRHWLAVTVLVLLGLPALGLGIWTAAALSWSYSEGSRAGYVQKISRKGWLCKTWEGTLYTDIAKGFRSDSFSFTVRSDSVAAAITALSGKRVTVTYQQHVGVPTSCFGETEYFVTAVEPSPE